MKYTLENGKIVNISDEDIKKKMKLYDLTKERAIQLWLEDNDYLVNEELEALDAKSKKVKINHGARADKPRKKSDKPRTVKVSDAKKEFFNALNEFLSGFCTENDAEMAVLKENKLFQVQYGGEIFKIDLIQQRKPK